MSSRETRLWYWLLFHSGLPAMRVKTILESWQQSANTLEAALAALPQSALAAGFNPEELPALQPPATLAAIHALRWNETLYPSSLLQLEVRWRPALLFYIGEPQLLSRPLLLFAPAPLDAQAAPMLEEALGQLIGDATFLPSAIRGTAQALALLNELMDSEGEGLLFVRQGLETLTLTAQEQQLLQQGRLLLISPLDKETPANPKWEAALVRVEFHAARHVLWISTTTPTPPFTDARTLWLTPTLPATPSMPAMHITDESSELIPWLLAAATTSSPPKTRAPLPAPATLPPLPPAETLRILERGGTVPEVLRRRLREP